MKYTLYIFIILLSFYASLSYAQEWSLPFSSKIEKNGKKLQGATVTLMQGSKQVMQTITGEDGAFKFQIPPNGDFTIIVTKQGHCSKKFQVSTRGVPADKQEEKFKGIDIKAISLFEPLPNIDYSVLNQPLVKITYNAAIDDFDYDESYSNQILDALDKLRQLELDAINKQKEQEANYQTAIKTADKAFQKKEWVTAKSNYAQASSLKPSENYPKDQLAQIDIIIKDQEALNKKALADAKAKIDDDALAKKKAEDEAARLAKEKADKLAAEKALADAKAKADADALAKKKADEEAARLAKEKADKLAAEKALADAKAKADADALAKKKADEEAARLAKEKADKLAAEKALADAKTKADADALAKKKADEEAGRLAKEKADKLAAEKALADAKAKADADALAKKKADEEVVRLAKEKADKLAAEKALADAKAKADADVLAKKKADEEAARLAKEKADKLAAEKALADAKAKVDADAIAKKKADEDAARLAKEKADKLAAEKALADAKAKADADALAKKKADEEAARFAKEMSDIKLKTDKEAALLASAEAKSKADADAAAKKKAEKEAATDKYRNAITIADDLFKSKKYSQAQKYYEEALISKAGDSYAKNRLVEIEKLQNSDTATSIDVDARQKALLAKYGPGVTEETIVANGVTIIQRVVVKETNAYVYQKKIFSWGGISFFRDSSPITESTFELETKP